MKSREIIGKEVIDAEARIIGPVQDLEIDLTKWTVTGIIVKKGFMKKISIAAGNVDKVGDKVVLKVALDKIQKTPA
ncbi:MAG: PRC-barrel domain-containing protein [Chloroflexi bacterium]|nr:PRC-barrel domain-containing protein [Chloroflexota bacterium]